MIQVTQKAIDTFYKKDEWKKIMENAMSENYSWEKAAKEYEKLY